jgi:hypothetical protein
MNRDDDDTLCFHGRAFLCPECAAEFRRALQDRPRLSTDMNNTSWGHGKAPGDGLYWVYGHRNQSHPVVRLARVRDGRVSWALNTGFIGYVDDVVGWWMPCQKPDPPTGLVD